MQRRTLVKKRQPAEGEAHESLHASAQEGQQGLFGTAISLAASRVNDLTPLQGLLPEGEDDNFISFSRKARIESSSSSSYSSSSSSSSSSEDRSDSQARVEDGFDSDRSDIPEKVEEPMSPTGSPVTRESFSGIIFEQRVAVDVREAHLTLVTLPSPITIQGPCGVFGLGGETSLNGYLLGQKRLLLASRHDRATAAPTKRLGTRTSEATTPSHDDVDPETVFGVVNWAWVQERLESWSRRNSVQVSLILVIQPRGTCRRQWFESGSNADPREVPSFIANRRYLATPQPVLEVISVVAKQRQAVAAVLGERDVGKSTMCRMLSNALLSQHGKCYWIDLDLGQPEFTVPGCLSITKITGPLVADVIPEKCRHLEKCYYLGTTSISCPVSYARAVKSLCDYVIANKCYPCVVNTHGWIQSSGRRGSLECLRRLRASHVIHMGKSHGGDDMEWSVGHVINDPTQGLNSSISTGRFWHGTDIRGGLPPIESSYTPTYVCRVHKIDATSTHGGATKANGKRDREETGSNVTHTSSGQPSDDAQIYRVIADYVVKPKGNNSKRRHTKWHAYLSPLWSGDDACRSEVAFELSKLPFVAIAGSDEASAAVNAVAVAKGALSEILKDSVVALCVQDDVGGAIVNDMAAAKVSLLSAFTNSPSVLCFGVVSSQQDGKVCVLLPHPASFVTDILGPHRGRIGIIVSPDTNDNGDAITRALRAAKQPIAN